MKTTMIGATAIAVLSMLTAAPGWALDPAAGAAPGVRPPEELAAQKLLPKAHDALWSKLVKSAVDYDEKKGTYAIRLTPEVKALDGTTVTLRGFILPMDGSDRTQHFLLSRNTPVCLYCPPGEPNEVVEVESVKPVAWTNKIVSMTGTFRLIADEEKALFFKMEGAAAKP